MFKSILRLLGTILIAVAFAFVLIMCVGERTKVSGHSMEPHLHDHDQVLLDKLTSVSYTHLTLPTNSRV